MSLFKIREWWVTQCGYDESYENSSLLVSKLNTEHDLIIVGSHNGVLRIFRPSSDKLENGQLLDFVPNDLLLETQCYNPILNIAAGRFVSGSQNYQIAILHPRCVKVYNLVSKTGVAAHGNQHSLIQVYDHTLRRSAYCFIVGPFGGTQNRDFVCVQSLDGMLSFFEQENFSFCCFLPNFLLPGPLAYVKNTDSFVTCNSNWQIESFRYKRLSEIGQNTNQDDTEGAKFDPDWSYNIGESVLDLVCVSLAMSDHCLMVLGERNLFCLTVGGRLKFMKRFDFSPHAFQPYFIEHANKLMVMVVSETSTLLIYEGTTLRWSAQLSYTPVAISRGNFANIRGSLVLLQENGALSCGYLGSEPMMFTAPPLVNRDLDFEKAEEELITLHKIIRSNRSSDIGFNNAAHERELLVTVTVSNHLQPCSHEHDSHILEQSVKMCTVTIELMPKSLFQEVQVSVVVDPPLRSSPGTFFLCGLDSARQLEAFVYQERPHEVGSLDVKVVTTSITSMDVPRVQVKTERLPMRLVVETCPPAKEAVHKVTLNINHQAAPLSALFPEYMGENSLNVNSNAIGFKNISGSGSAVTLMLAKSSQRYRLQSESMASMALLADELIRRLKKHYELASEFSLTQNFVLPTSGFLEVVDRHFEQKCAAAELQVRLTEYTTQFRLIQKRLIAKFKDRNPTPLRNLDKILQDTHADIVDISDRLQRARDELFGTQCELFCAVRLVMSLLKCSDVQEELYKKVASVFVTPLYDIDGQSWEDVIDSCTNHLLRTILAKSEKDRLKGLNTFEQVIDIGKFKKRLLQVVERLSKGGPIIENQIDEENEEDQEDGLAQLNELQLGRKIAESSVRAQSAKLRPKRANRVYFDREEDDDDVVENI